MTHSYLACLLIPNTQFHIDSGFTGYISSDHGCRWLGPHMMINRGPPPTPHQRRTLIKGMCRSRQRNNNIRLLHTLSPRELLQGPMYFLGCVLPGTFCFQKSDCSGHQGKTGVAVKRCFILTRTGIQEE